MRRVNVPGIRNPVAAVLRSWCSSQHKIGETAAAAFQGLVVACEPANWQQNPWTTRSGPNASFRSSTKNNNLPVSFRRRHLLADRFRAQAKVDVEPQAPGCVRVSPSLSVTMNNPQTIRHLNEIDALNALFRSGGMSRAELARGNSRTEPLVDGKHRGLADVGRSCGGSAGRSQARRLDPGGWWQCVCRPMAPSSPALKLALTD